MSVFDDAKQQLQALKQRMADKLVEYDRMNSPTKPAELEGERLLSRVSQYRQLKAEHDHRGYPPPPPHSYPLAPPEPVKPPLSRQSAGRQPSKPPPTATTTTTTTTATTAADEGRTQPVAVKRTKDESLLSTFISSCDTVIRSKSGPDSDPVPSVSPPTSRSESAAATTLFIPPDDEEEHRLAELRHAKATAAVPMGAGLHIVLLRHNEGHARAAITQLWSEECTEMALHVVRSLEEKIFSQSAAAKPGVPLEDEPRKKNDVSELRQEVWSLRQELEAREIINTRMVYDSRDASASPPVRPPGARADPESERSSLPRVLQFSSEEELPPRNPSPPQEGEQWKLLSSYAPIPPHPLLDPSASRGAPSRDSSLVQGPSIFVEVDVEKLREEARHHQVKRGYLLIQTEVTTKEGHSARWQRYFCQLSNGHFMTGDVDDKQLTLLFPLAFVSLIKVPKKPALTPLPGGGRLFQFTVEYHKNVTPSGAIEVPATGVVNFAAAEETERTSWVNVLRSAPFVVARSAAPK